MPTAPPDWSCSLVVRRRSVFGLVPRLLGDDVDRRFARAADHLCGELHRQDGVVRIDAALEAIRGVGLNAEAARGAADERRLEPGALEEDVLRRRGDLALRAADDPAEGHGAVGVGDDDGVGIDLAQLVVEAAHALAGAAAADDDALPLQAVEVEGVQRMA